MAKKPKIRPLDDRVVVEPIEAEETTAGGIVLPDSAKEKPQRGTVVAVGPGKLLDSGSRGELSVAVGDEVIYGKYGGSDIEVDGDDVKISRRAVKATIAACNVAQVSNRATGALFSAASRGLPLASDRGICPPPGARLVSDRVA